MLHTHILLPLFHKNISKYEYLVTPALVLDVA